MHLRPILTSLDTPASFKKSLRTFFNRAPLVDSLLSKGNLHHYTVASVPWCYCRENNLLKGTFGDKFLRFSEKISVKVSKNILSIHQKAH